MWFSAFGVWVSCERRRRFKHALIFVCVAMLPSLVLQHTSVRPYQRGLYCGDSSLSYPYKKSTVPSSVLTAVGLTLPFVSVSPAHKHGAHVSGNTEGRNSEGWWMLMAALKGQFKHRCKSLVKTFLLHLTLDGYPSCFISWPSTTSIILSYFCH